MTTPLNLATLVAVNLAANTEATRYYLNGVCVEITPTSVTYVATNGHMLLAHRLMSTQEDIGCFIIPSSVIDEVKAWAKPSKRRDTALSLTLLGGLDAELALDGRSRRFQFIDGTFPDWRRVLPKAEKAGIPLAFNGDLLKRVDTFAREALDLSPLNFDVFYAPDGAPMVVTFPGRDALALVMPRRHAGNSVFSRPAWLDGRAS